MDKVTVRSDSLSSSDQTTLAPQCEVGAGARTSVEMSHPSTPPAIDIYTDLACKPVGRHVDLLPQHPSPCSSYPPDCIVLCSFVLNSTLIVNEDQVVDRFGVMQPTYAIIHDKCVNMKKNPR